MNYELSAIVDKVKGKFICLYEGKSQMFQTKEEFELSQMEKNCTVLSISAKEDVIVLELQKRVSEAPDLSGEWIKKYKKMYGEEPSMF